MKFRDPLFLLCVVLSCASTTSDQNSIPETTIKDELKFIKQASIDKKDGKVIRIQLGSLDEILEQEDLSLPVSIKTVPVHRPPVAKEVVSPNKHIFAKFKDKAATMLRNGLNELKREMQEMTADVPSRLETLEGQLTRVLREERGVSSSEVHTILGSHTHSDLDTLRNLIAADESIVNERLSELKKEITNMQETFGTIMNRIAIAEKASGDVTENNKNRSKTQLEAISERMTLLESLFQGTITDLATNMDTTKVDVAVSVRLAVLSSKVETIESIMNDAIVAMEISSDTAMEQLRQTISSDRAAITVKLQNVDLQLTALNESVVSQLTTDRSAVYDLRGDLEAVQDDVRALSDLPTHVSRLDRQLEDATKTLAPRTLVKELQDSMAAWELELGSLVATVDTGMKGVVSVEDFEQLRGAIKTEGTMVDERLILLKRELVTMQKNFETEASNMATSAALEEAQSLSVEQWEEVSTRLNDLQTLFDVVAAQQIRVQQDMSSMGESMATQSTKMESLEDLIHATVEKSVSGAVVDQLRDRMDREKAGVNSSLEDLSNQLAQVSSVLNDTSSQLAHERMTVKSILEELDAVQGELAAVVDVPLRMEALDAKFMATSSSLATAEVVEKLRHEFVLASQYNNDSISSVQGEIDALEAKMVAGMLNMVQQDAVDILKGMLASNEQNVEQKFADALNELQVTQQEQRAAVVTIAETLQDHEVAVERVSSRLTTLGTHVQESMAEHSNTSMSLIEGVRSDLAASEAAAEARVTALAAKLDASHSLITQEMAVLASKTAVDDVHDIVTATVSNLEGALSRLTTVQEMVESHAMIVLPALGTDMEKVQDDVRALSDLPIKISRLDRQLEDATKTLAPRALVKELQESMAAWELELGSLVATVDSGMKGVVSVEDFEQLRAFVEEDEQRMERRLVALRNELVRAADRLDTTTTPSASISTSTSTASTTTAEESEAMREALHEMSALAVVSEQQWEQVSQRMHAMELSFRESMAKHSNNSMSLIKDVQSDVAASEAAAEARVAALAAKLDASHSLITEEMAWLASNTTDAQEQFVRTIHSTVEEISANVSSAWSFFNQLSSSFIALNVSTLTAMFALQTTVDALSSLDIRRFMWKSNETMTQLNDTMQVMMVATNETAGRLRDLEIETGRIRDWEVETGRALQQVPAKEDLEALSAQLNALSKSVDAHVKVPNNSPICPHMPSQIHHPLAQPLRHLAHPLTHPLTHFSYHLLHASHTPFHTPYTLLIMREGP